jgi:ribosomal-protein-alanine N-acetyltransferase
VLPRRIQWLESGLITLRGFESRDERLVASVADDPLIPLITTVPATGDAADVRAYIDRQHDRLTAGAGYSFAVADPVTDDAVGQIGLWTSDIAAGRATTGYWIAAQHRRRGYGRAALASLTDWALTLNEVARSSCTWSRGMRHPGASRRNAATNAKDFSGLGSGSAMNGRTCTSTASFLIVPVDDR